jgi:hypothetical protein
MGDEEINKVAELIDPITGSWKIDLIRRNFILSKADAILNIPLRRDGGEDFWAWSLENTCVYSVKTAYRSLVNRNEQRALDEGTITETSITDQHMWKSLWKIPVMPKVRVFWWRVLRGILPVQSILRYRHILQSNRCKLCLDHDEDLMHALVTCTHAKRVWDEARSWLDIQLPSLNPVTWAKDIVSAPIFLEVDRPKIITVMWAIWSSRNNWTHDRGFFDPVQALKMAKEALAVLGLPKKMTGVLPGHGWRPPEDDHIKINTDGGLDLEAQKGGARGVVRTRSTCLGTWSKPYPGVTHPLTIEAMVLRDGVIFARLRGYQRVVMETDCLEMVNLWEARHGSRSTVAPILQEIGELALSFICFRVQHAYRSANLPAHLCAKHACTLSLTSSWIDVVPDFLITSLQANDAGAGCVE